MSEHALENCNGYKRKNAMKLVRQRERRDCGVACVAMAAGCTYERASEVFVLKGPGSTWVDAVAALSQLGKSVQIYFRGEGSLSPSPYGWPPSPFAPAHIIQCGTHWLAMSKEGCWFDPNVGKVESYVGAGGNVLIGIWDAVGVSK